MWIKDAVSTLNVRSSLRDSPPWLVQVPIDSWPWMRWSSADITKVGKIVCPTLWWLRQLDLSKQKTYRNNNIYASKCAIPVTGKNKNWTKWIHDILCRTYSSTRRRFFVQVYLYIMVYLTVIHSRPSWS